MIGRIVDDTIEGDDDRNRHNPKGNNLLISTEEPHISYGIAILLQSVNGMITGWGFPAGVLSLRVLNCRLTSIRI